MWDFTIVDVFICAKSESQSTVKIFSDLENVTSTSTTADIILEILPMVKK